ncbi:MAG: phage terminase large subunit family protein [Ignavibacteria bacterium]|nr:phage terminase large subunit family protein [Ignavibacteria bacterium]
MEIVTVSTIRCPECGFTHEEDIPENACLWYYTCLGCGTILRPLEKDCCVFCSYGTFKCIPVQMNIGCCDDEETPEVSGQ